MAQRVCGRGTRHLSFSAIQLEQGSYSVLHILVLDVAVQAGLAQIREDVGQDFDGGLVSLPTVGQVVVRDQRG